MFDFNSFPFKLSGKTVAYICPKCKYKFDAPIEAVLEFEQEDEWNGLPISTPPYTICAKCNFDKCVPIDYVSKRGFHHTKIFLFFGLFIMLFSLIHFNIDILLFLMTFLLYKK